MRRRRWAFASIPFGLLAITVAAYLGGFWIPNYPSDTQFPVRGIDVSHHQGSIDWSKVLVRDVHFVYIKATEGGDYLDASFADNWKGSSHAGIRHGAYHFFSLKTSGRVQAQNFIDHVPVERGALPPVIDLEFGGNSAFRPSMVDFQRELSEFVDLIRKAYGKEPIFYLDQKFAAQYLQGFTMKEMWVASIIFRQDADSKWMFWQFSERMKVPGIDGYVDQDVFHGSKREFDRL